MAHAVFLHVAKVNGMIPPNKLYDFLKMTDAYLKDCKSKCKGAFEHLFWHTRGESAICQFSNNFYHKKELYDWKELEDHDAIKLKIRSDVCIIIK